jgi:hypothetical protein
MLHQNITLKLNKAFLHEVKVYSVQQNKSLSRLMVEALKTFLYQSQGYSKAQSKALSHMKKGLKLGGGPYFSSRNELHRRNG